MSNAIGPLIAIWLIWTEGQVSQVGSTPPSILLFGGFGISVGLWMYGRHVIKTMGEDLTGKEDTEIAQEWAVPSVKIFLKLKFQHLHRLADSLLIWRQLLRCLWHHFWASLFQQLIARYSSCKIRYRP